MNSKIKNIIIFVIIAAVLILVYIFFIKKGPEEAPLVSSSGVLTTENSGTMNTNNAETINASKDFVSLLLSVKSIKLDDQIFSDPAFLSLRDSSIFLVQDGNEGRPNPFAPMGTEATIIPTTDTTPITTTPTTPTTPTKSTKTTKPTTPPVSVTP